MDITELSQRLRTFKRSSDGLSRPYHGIFHESYTGFHQGVFAGLPCTFMGFRNAYTDFRDAVKVISCICHGSSQNFRGEIVGDFMGAVTILRVIVRSECNPRTHHYRECFHTAAIEVHSNFRGEIIGDFMGAVTILWVTVRFECVPRTHHYRVYLVYNQAPGPGTAPLPGVLVVRRQHAGYGSETVAPKRLYQVRLRLTRGALCSTPGMRLTLNLS